MMKAQSLASGRRQFWEEGRRERAAATQRDKGLPERHSAGWGSTQASPAPAAGVRKERKERLPGGRGSRAQMSKMNGMQTGEEGMEPPA